MSNPPNTNTSRTSQSELFIEGFEPAGQCSKGTRRAVGWRTSEFPDQLIVAQLLEAGVTA